MIFDRVDHRTDNGHPDGNFENCQGKGDGGSPLNRDNGADDTDGDVTNPGHKDNDSRQENMWIEHDRLNFPLNPYGYNGQVNVQMAIVDFFVGTGGPTYPRIG